MSAYMRDKFPFCGLAAPERAALQLEAWSGYPHPDETELHETVRSLWGLDEREYQYAGAYLLRRHVRSCTTATMALAEQLVTTKPWWDTVDELAAAVVGPLVARLPALRPQLDAWIDSDDLWLARTAIIHQLGYKANTDRELLFTYCLRRAGERDFFIRKAIGWALREYSKTDPEAVARFVADHESELSGLSRREATRVIERRAARAAAPAGAQG